jgi:hypothetical protein
MFKHFVSIKKTYAERSWGDIKEELSTSYRKEEIKAIECILRFFRRRFTSGDFINRMSDLSNDWIEVSDISNKKTTSSILSDLYRVGVLGNLYEVNERGITRTFNRWAFRGDIEIQLEQLIVVHNGLIKYFGYQ